MLVHLAVHQDQIRSYVVHCPDEPAHRQRCPRLRASAAHVQKSPERPGTSIGRGELIVPARVQREERQTVKIDESTVLDPGSKRQPMAGGGQTPAELHAGVEQAPETARHDEDSGQ